MTRLWAYLRSDDVVFATPEVDRFFIACEQCRRVRPHYRAYPPSGSTETGFCPCGHNRFKAVRLPEWRAAWWVLGVGWLWRKTILRRPQWDPRMPLRRVDRGT